MSLYKTMVSQGFTPDQENDSLLLRVNEAKPFRFMQVTWHKGLNGIAKVYAKDKQGNVTQKEFDAGKVATAEQLNAEFTGTID